MKKDNRSNILFRYGFVIVAILALSACIVVKLCNTTIVDADKWNESANKLLRQTKVIVPGRGNILASDGSVLATNLNFYTARIDYRAEKFNEKLFRDTIDALASKMAEHFPVRTAEGWKKHLLKPLEKVRERRPRAYKLLNGLSHADMETMRTFPFFSIKNRNRNGLIFEKYMRRFNPYGDMARRSIGGVGATRECKEVHGISGLEKALDSMLFGTPGIAKKVALTRGIVNWTDKPAIPGLNIRTTIDIKMQDIVENELNNLLTYVDADWGVAVLMEVATGDIKAISNLEKNPSAPGYIEGMNRAVLGYEPGSVIKPISMLIALEDGIVSNLQEQIPIGRSFPYAGGRGITDSHFNSSLSVAEVIEQSSNIGMTRIITRRYDAHPGGFYHRLKQIGFLEPMHTGIAGESTPRIDSVPTNRGGRISLSRQCYGYATEIPPLYTLSVYNAIANGGRYVRPRLVSRLTGEDIDSVLPVTYIRDRICSEENAKKLQHMLTNVVWGPHGTGRRLKSDLVRIAGKTGTCYMIEGGSYNTGKKRLAFCGFFPAEAPKYSCIVLTCHPKQNALGAASTSGEVLKNVALKLYSRGMLGNSSDLSAESAVDDSPVLYASARTGHHERVRDELGVKGARRSLAKPKAVAKGVPDVVGYGLRDAIAILEKAGYNVTFHGSGYVTRQTPAAGGLAPRGQRVTLSLTE